MRARVWARRLLIVLVSPVLFYLLAANLFLSTPLGPWAVNRRPERLAIEWAHAWSLYPGDLQVRGLRVAGHAPRAEWWVRVDRGHGRLRLGALLDRRFVVEGFEGSGVRSGTTRKRASGGASAERPSGAAAPAAGAPGAEGSAGAAGGERRRWQVRFDRVRLDAVRELGLDGLALTAPAGAARIEGSFSLLAGGTFELLPTTLRANGAALAAGGGVLARDLEVALDLTIAAYAPREHAGAEGFGFVSGALRATGRLADESLSARLGKLGVSEAPGAGLGTLALELRVEKGQLEEGSHLTLSTPPRGAAGAGPAASPLSLAATVERAPGGGEPALHLTLSARDLSLARPGGGAPLFAADELSLTATTPELHLSRLLTTGRQWRDRGAPPAGAFAGDLVARGLRVAAQGRRVAWSLAAERATGRLDLAALFGRRLRLDGVDAAGVTIALDARPQAAPAASAGSAAAGASEPPDQLLGQAPGQEPAPAPAEPPTAAPGDAAAQPAGSPSSPAPGAPWSFELTNAHLSAVHEIVAAGNRLIGDARLAGDLSYETRGPLAVGRLELDLDAGRLLAGEDEVASGIGLHGTASLAPVVPSEQHGAALLRALSADLTCRARVSSLAFLHRFLAKAPWLGLAGRGDLLAAARLAEGRLLAGSHAVISSAAVEATILDDLATGKGAVTVTVDDTPAGPRAHLGVSLDRFEMASRSGGSEAAYIRGAGLRVAATSASLDLAQPATDLTATVDMPDSAVPDLTVYNSYLPAGSGVEILDGSGRLSLHLDLDTARQTGTGEIHLTSDALRVGFQDIELAGRLDLRTKLASSDLASRRFSLDGTRLGLDEVALRTPGEEPDERDTGWWANLELTDSSVLWKRPMALESTATIEMKDAGFLLHLFARKRHYLDWFARLLDLEDITGHGRLRLAKGLLAIDALRATNDKLDLRSRMRFSAGQKSGALLVRYGRLTVGFELENGKRELKLRHAEDWYEGRANDP